MNDPTADAIVEDLDRHAQPFDLSGKLGDDLLDVAAADVARSFDLECDPDDNRWPDLASEYARWKARHFPGRPIGVREGHLRENLMGDRDKSPTSAFVAIGATDRAKDEAAWMIEGDELRNRPPRRLGELSAQGQAESDHVLDQHFREMIR